MITKLSKRDYFAGQALMGLLARNTGSADGRDVHASTAAEAYAYADEMLKLSKTLLDPIEIDPDELSAEEEQQKEPRTKESGE